MSARRKSWFGIAKSFVKAVEKESNAAKKAQANKVAVTQRSVTPITSVQRFSVSVTGGNGKEYAIGMRPLPQNEKYISSIKQHVGKLATFYKEHAADYTYDGDANPVTKLVSDLYPKADAHTCPYCGVIHDFTATRARKCPDCGKQMIVRQGVFLTEDEVSKLDQKISDYYDKAGLATQLKNCIESIQSYASGGNYGKAFIAIAEGYQDCAAIYNQRYEGGYGAWDFSWRILNSEALEVAGIGISNNKDLISNGYNEVLFARGMHGLREVKYDQTATAMNKHAKLAIAMFYNYLVALDTVGLTDWQYDSAVKNIHIAKILGKVSEDDIKDIQSRTFTHASPKTTEAVFNKTIQTVEEYVFLESDPTRLRQLIY